MALEMHPFGKLPHRYYEWNTPWPTLMRAVDYNTKTGYYIFEAINTFDRTIEILDFNERQIASMYAIEKETFDMAVLLYG